MAENEKIECPICAGSGEINAPKPNKKMEERTKIALKLKKAGFSFREIMKLMEYKSPRSISYLFEKEKIKTSS